MQKESMTDNPAAKRFTRRKKNGDTRKVIHRKMSIRNRSKKRVFLAFQLFLVIPLTICWLSAYEVKLLSLNALKRSL